MAPCFSAAAPGDLVALLLRSSLMCVCCSLMEGTANASQGEEQPEWTESCLRARLLNVGSFRFKMRRPDYLPHHLRVLVLKAAPAPLRIRPENPQYPWNAALLSRASPSRVRLAPKTAQAALREERVLKLSGACLGEKIHFCRCIKGASGGFNKF